MAKKKTPPLSSMSTVMFVIKHVEDDSVWYEAYSPDRLDGIDDGEIVAEYRLNGSARYKKVTTHSLDVVD